LATVGDLRRGVAPRLVTPVWDSAGGVTRHWQDDRVVGDAFWEALDLSDRDVPSPAAAAAPAKPRKQKDRKKKPIWSVHRPHDHAGQTVTEQIVTFVARRELGPGPVDSEVDLEVVGSAVLGRSRCDVVRATVGPRARRNRLANGSTAPTYNIWVDTERLVILRVAKLLADEPVEIVDFLEIPFDD